MSSALVCQGSVSPSSECKRLACKAKSSISTWWRPSSCFLVSALMYSRNLACTSVLSAAVELATILSSVAIFVSLVARNHWVHKRFSVITGRLVADPNYVCPRCCSKAWPSTAHQWLEVDIGGTMYNVEVTFCYQGGILCSSGAVTTTLLTDVVWPGESSGNSCLFSPPSTSSLRCGPRCTQPCLFGYASW